MKKVICILLFPFLTTLVIAQKPIKKSKIAFVSNLDKKNSEIFVIDSDGSNEKRITFNDWNDESPSWSPDGKQIAFLSCKDTVCAIYIMSADGSDIHQVTKSGRNICNPKWSPDGKWIAYEDNGRDLCLVSPNGKQYKYVPLGKGANRNFTWSPDSKQIVFASCRDADIDTNISCGMHYELYIMNADTPLSIQRITYNNEVDKFPCWSLDGKRFAYLYEQVMKDGNDEQGIAVMNIDTTERKKLVAMPWAHMPTWSPDSKKIAVGFYNREKDRWDIYTIDPDGKNLTRVTNNGRENFTPAWSPYLDE